MTTDHGSEGTPQFDPLADEDRDVFELRYDLQKAREEAHETADRWYRLASGPFVSADALVKPTGVLYAKLRDWFDEPLNRDSSESAADTATSAVNWYLRSALVSDLDTTEDGGDHG